MARRSGDSAVTLSVFDRLIDLEPKVRSEAPMTRSQSVHEFKASLRRDLEWLLNTRQPVDPPPESATELRRSLYNYGLPDITSMSLAAIEDRERLGRVMETVLATFEPRLANVKVTIAPNTEAKSHILRFLIEGLMRIDPAPEYVTFDTMLELTNGEYAVKGS